MKLLRLIRVKKKNVNAEKVRYDLNKKRYEGCVFLKGKGVIFFLK